MQKNKFLFLIRAYNERTRIESVIEGILKEWYREILVIDDGSVDGTTSFLRERFPTEIHIIRHPINRGWGAAMETGFAWVREHASESDFEYIVTFDADGQHDILDMKVFLEQLQKHPHAKVIYGSRFIKKNKLQCSMVSKDNPLWR